MKFSVSMIFADSPQEVNTSQWRMIRPGRALGKAGYNVRGIPIKLFQENSEDARKALESSHIIVVERNYIGDVLTQMMYWKVRGRTIILNWDDNYELIEETNISYPYWHSAEAKTMENGEEKKLTIFPHPKRQFIWGLNIAHAATLPSKELMKYYSKYHIPMYHLPNYFETEHYINIPKEKRDYITIGWGGSVSHVPSFRDSGIFDALKNVVNIRNNVKVMICGDKRIYDEVKLPENKKIFQGYVPYDQWGKTIAKKFDIGIAPLCGDYDKYRSWIKPIEFNLTQTPWIASDNVAYDEFKDLNHGKIIDNNVDSWTRALLDTIDNLEEEKIKIAGEPFEFAKKQDVSLHVEEIANLYRKIAREHGHIDLYGDSPPDQIPIIHEEF